MPSPATMAMEGYFQGQGTDPYEAVYAPPRRAWMDHWGIGFEIVQHLETNVDRRIDSYGYSSIEDFQNGTATSRPVPLIEETVSKYLIRDRRSGLMVEATVRGRLRQVVDVMFRPLGSRMSPGIAADPTLGPNEFRLENSMNLLGPSRHDSFGQFRRSIDEQIFNSVMIPEAAHLPDRKRTPLEVWES